MNRAPIGIFDSGVGGMSVWKEIDMRLPHESLIYYADSANCPYGEKSREEVIALSLQSAAFLADKGSKLIVIACNTATSTAIDCLRDRFNLPFVGIVPAVKPAAINSRTGVIGILATRGTLQSVKFDKARKEYARYAEIIAVEAGDLVEIVERGRRGTREAEDALRRHIEPMLKRNIDRLVLGCTHFPFLIDDIKKIVGNSVILDNPAPAIAQRTDSVLREKKLAAPSDNRKYTEFHSSGDINALKSFVRTVLPEMDTASRDNSTAQKYSDTEYSPDER
jgi:glutamate racemase